MPLISDLKSLGTLPAPELQTVLTVYLINLDHSQETNLVYISRDPVSDDASPPAHLRFECAETRPKPGDVLICAPRVPQRTAFVHLCWVFDGTAWEKTNPDLEVMMVHPEHPKYQLVILPGPSVKWELKSDSDRESLTVPKSPHASSHALGTLRTVVTDACTQIGHKPSGGHSQRPCEHTTESGTPDGSTELCGSNTGSPISESLSDRLPGFERKQTMAIDCSRFSDDHATKSPDPRPSDSLPKVDCEITASGRRPQTPKFVPAGRQSPTNHLLTTPQEGRALSPDHPVTPSPRSPKSTNQLFSRTVRNPITPSRSTPLSPRKRSRPRSGEHEYAWPASLSSSDINYEASRVSPFPAARRRRLADGSEISLATRSHTSSTANLKTPAPENEADVDGDGEDDSDFSPKGEVVPSGNVTLEQKVKQQSTAQNSPPESTASGSLMGRLEGNGVENTDQNLNVASDLQEDLAESLGQKGESLDTAVRLAQQLHAFISRSAAVLAESKLETDLKVRKLEGERDHALAAMNDLKRSEEEARNACRKADELANARKDDIERLRRSESLLLQARNDLGMQLASAQSELDMLTIAHQTRLESDAKLLEETKGRLEEQKRRADHFEKSLRVAQEALQRQRTLAQEAEACQRGTIAQLAKEFQEKDQSAKQLAEEVETMTQRITKLSASLSESEQALRNEKESARQAINELECVRTTVKENCGKIERLDAARVEDGCNLAAAEERVSTLNTRIEELQKEEAARDATLSQEVRKRKDVERRYQELHLSVVYLDSLRNMAEKQLVQEFASRQKAESLRESCLAQFSEYLSLTDRERRRLEHLLFEEESSLRQLLEDACLGLESAQADCTYLKNRISAEITYRQQRLEVAFKEEKALRHQLQSKDHEVKEAQRECALTKSSAAVERDRFNNDRSSLRVQTERELSDLRAQVAESVKAKEQAEARYAALNVTAKEQSQALMAKHAEYKKFQVELSSECERLTQELSSNRQRIEVQFEDSRKQMETLRGEHESAVHGFQVQHASLESELRCAAEALASSQATVSNKDTELQTERERFATELSSVRTKCSDVEKQLIAAQLQRSEVEETLTKERASFSDEREQLVFDRTSAQESLSSLQSSLQTELSELQERLEASFKTQQSDFALKLSAMQTQVKGLEERLSDAEQRRTHLENLFSDERAAFERQLRSNILELEEARTKFANATAELTDERQRAQDLSSNRATLEQELNSCRSQLAVSEEKGTRVEAEQAGLQLQYSSVSAKLETAQGECERLKADLLAERERFGAERSMSPDSLRGKVASLETCLEHERAVARTLREEQTKDQSSNYWSDLSSQLLRSLHEAQDRLRAEEAARQALQDQLTKRARTAIKGNRAKSTKAPGLPDPV